MSLQFNSECYALLIKVMLNWFLFHPFLLLFPFSYPWDYLFRGWYFAPGIYDV